MGNDEDGMMKFAKYCGNCQVSLQPLTGHSESHTTRMRGAGTPASDARAIESNHAQVAMRRAAALALAAGLQVCSP